MIHGGKFERNVGAGDRAGGTLIENRVGVPPGRFVRKKFDQVGVAPGETLVVRVRVAFLREDRTGIAAQPRLNDFVIPIGSFDEANGEGRGPLLAQGKKPVEIAARGLQVGLDHDAEMRPRGEFGIERDSLEQAVGDFVEVPLLEIEVDEGVEFLGTKQQRTHPLQQPLHAAVGIGGIEEVIHRG